MKNDALTMTRGRTN